MSIALVVTRGYSNGTLTGEIADVATRGYTIGPALTLVQASFAVESAISPNGLGVLSSITVDGEAVVAGLVSGKGVLSVISADGIGVSTKFEG